MNILSTLKTGLILASIIFCTNSFANESVGEKAETMTNKTTDAVKETYRDAKDATCKMINGKMECAAKKVINKTKTAADKAKTKATEVINQVD